MLVNILLAAAAWAVAVLKFDAARQRWKADHRFLYSWSGIVFFASGLTFQIDAVYQAVDDLTGVSNLSWFLIDVFLFLALYCGAIFAYAVAETPTPRWMHLVLIVALGVHLAIFLTGITFDPEITWSKHRVKTLHGFAFMETENVYGIVMGTVMAIVFGHLFRGEQHPLTRLRWGLLCAIASLGASIYLFYVLQCLAEVSPTLPFLDGAGTLGGGARWAVGLLWPLAIVPNRVYRIALKPFTFADKLSTLRKLDRARARIGRLKEMVYPDTVTTVQRPTLRDALVDPDFHIYRTVIAILDAARSIRLCSDHLQEEHARIAFDTQITSRLLGETDEDQATYENLIERCLEAGRVLQKRQMAQEQSRLPELTAVEKEDRQCCRL
jgi:hypothetical protein